MIVVKVPAKVILLGEHYVHETGAIVTAVNRYLTLTATPTDLPQLTVHADADAQTGGDALAHGVAAVLRALEPMLPSADLKYALHVTSEIPARVGLGSSSAVVVGTVAMLRALHGLPVDQAAIFALAREVERKHSGASGVDAAGCTWGGTHYYKPRTGTTEEAIVPLPERVPDTLYVTLSGTPHDASCTERVTDASTMRRLLAKAVRARLTLDAWDALLGDAHALLAAQGLSTPAVDAICARVRGKVTGQGRGGAVVSVREGTHGLAVDRHGVQVMDGTRTTVPREMSWTMPRLFGPGLVAAAANGRVGLGVAHPNIALVKYWGKHALQMPDNASISLSLPYFVTKTRVWLRRHADASMPSRCSFPDARVCTFVETMLGDALPWGVVVELETHNSFPSACGIASSASGFAALVHALADLAHVPVDHPCVVQWARLGSGSAVRSAAVPPCTLGEASLQLVSWQSATTQVHPIHPTLRDLEHALVVFDPFPKPVGSSAGHDAAPSCPFHRLRTAMADGHTRDVIEAFEVGDVARIRDLTEAESLTMHLVMLGSTPSLRYMNDASIDFASRFVRFRNERHIDAFHTVDAGSNVHLLFLPSARPFVHHFVQSHKHMFTLSRGVRTARYSVVMLCGKRYSGKTHLAQRLSSSVPEPIQVVNLSSALKRAYWQMVGEEVNMDLPEDRALKERHRARMIAFGQAERDKDPYVWCRRVWGTLAAAPTRILVTDARRSTDVTFFQKCTNCTLVRVRADDDERCARGWVYDPRVDDDESETGLDDATYDRVMTSGDDVDTLVWR